MNYKTKQELKLYSWYLTGDFKRKKILKKQKKENFYAMLFMVILWLVSIIIWGLGLV